jgi:hypothetical protein
MYAHDQWVAAHQVVRPPYAGAGFTVLHKAEFTEFHRDPDVICSAGFHPAGDSPPAALCDRRVHPATEQHEGPCPFGSGGRVFWGAGRQTTYISGEEADAGISEWGELDG